MALRSVQFGRGTMAVAALMVSVSVGATLANAGGFQIKEQSALGQGSSFAGFGAQDSISAMGVNASAVTSQDGLNSYSSITAILPSATITDHGSTISGGGFPAGFPASAVPGALGGGATSADIGRDAYVPATYGSYQFKAYDPRMYIGLAITSQFGLATEPDRRWIGSTVGDSTKLFTTNINPVLGYKFSDQLSVAAGPAFEYAHGTLKFATGVPQGANSFFDGDDFAVGATAGLTYKPAPGTVIGLGWRSAITHELDGAFVSNGSPVSAAQAGSAAAAAALNAGLNAGVATRVELRLPDVVNLSVTQAVSPNTKLLGTVEWTNWSTFNDLTLNTTGSGRAILGNPLLGFAVNPGTQLGSISAKWDDGWFFSGGLEHKYNDQLTVRAGGAYEISPIRAASQRIVSIPDADRIWASAGFSYALNNTLTLDFGYSHLFVQSAGIDRTSLIGQNFLAPQTHLIANLDADIDIVSVGLKVKLGN